MMKSLFSKQPSGEIESEDSFPLDNLTPEKRRDECIKLREKYPDRIAVLVKRHNNKSTKIDKGKFLIPDDATFGVLMTIIRKRIQLPAEKALFLFVNNVIPPMSAHVGTLYENHKSDDGFLRVVYSEENTFGDFL